MWEKRGRGRERESLYEIFSTKETTFEFKPVCNAKFTARSQLSVEMLTSHF
jgi:hypothetical protein